MIFWSLNTRLYLTMENRWVLDEKFEIETTDVKTMNVWSLNTSFYLTMEYRRCLDEEFQIETADEKTMNFCSIHSFLLQDSKTIVS